MVFNTTFSNISVISWWSVLLVKGTGVPGENHWQTNGRKQQCLINFDTCTYLRACRDRCHIYMIDSDQRPYSILCPLLTSTIITNIGPSNLRICSYQRPFQIFRSMADLLVRVKIMAYICTSVTPLDVDLKKVRNGHRFENWTPIWEYEKGHRFENSKKGLRSEVCVSDVEIYVYGSSIHM